MPTPWCDYPPCLHYLNLGVLSFLQQPWFLYQIVRASECVWMVCLSMRTTFLNQGRWKEVGMEAGYCVPPPTRTWPPSTTPGPGTSTLIPYVNNLMSLDWGGESKPQTRRCEGVAGTLDSTIT